MDARGQAYPKLLSVAKIWDLGMHNSMTDLCRFHNNWFCVFREAEEHAGESFGTIRLLVSPDGYKWDSIARFSLPEKDLRDPKLSITPHGRLMLLTTAISNVKNRGKIECQSLVSFSFDAVNWSPLIPIEITNEWLWRVTWFHGKAYGLTYRHVGNAPHDQTQLRLYYTDNGIKYTLIADLHVPGNPSEGTLQLFSSGEMMALVRRGQGRNAWVGRALPPYDTWEWNDAGRYLAGPNFIITNDNILFEAGRSAMFTPYGLHEKMTVGLIEHHKIAPLLFLPSAVDCGYPGMTLIDDQLYISYYSAHENKAAIYFAILKIQK